jgi:pimeloyl-ACP methyl ester carboxylesterase
MTGASDIPIALLPGMDGTGILLADLRARLSKRQPVETIFYPADPSLGYEALTELVMKRLPGERCIVLGESFSGPIAIEVAARAPHRVAGLVLAASFARSPLPAALATRAARLDLRWVPRRAVEAALLGRFGTPALRASLHQVLATLPREVVRRRIAEVAAVDKRERLGQVPCPILCLAGRRDRLAGRPCAEEIAQAHPRCSIALLDAPHMLLEPHAEAAAGAINTFCDQVGRTLPKKE